MTTEIFDQNLPQLKNIFREVNVKRLREIFNSTETAWQNNLNRLADKKVENILIAEAAPWSESGTPRYFYNQIESRYHRIIWRALFPCISIPSDNEKAFIMLADKNFLLIDTVPFSMSYSGKRNRKNYFEIVANSLEWWTGKLKSDKLNFAKKVNVAFAFKLNGRFVIKAMNGLLKLKDGQTIKLTEDLIATDNSNFTNSDKLRAIFKL